MIARYLARLFCRSVADLSEPIRATAYSRQPCPCGCGGTILLFADADRTALVVIPPAMAEDLGLDLIADSMEREVERLEARPVPTNPRRR